MLEPRETCPRCQGTGTVETCDAVMALAYAIRLTRCKPKATGAMPCPCCSEPQIEQRETRT